ncbi:MAG: hypothetical protein CK426_01440 [Legionella sp.]|nr:MAG: hypothetical protein CK423_04540 [Legionella sp.]PJD99742.1 MAG: hypothetical protein CK426_01440 [Legionella sp.]
MKKSIRLSIFYLFVSSKIVCASVSCDSYNDLRVELKNYGSDNCHLIQSKLLNGSLYESSFPSILAATGEKYSFTLTGVKTEAVLKYQCGEYKKFTLYMGQYTKPTHYHTTIDAEMINANDVFERHQKKETWGGGCTHKYPGTLFWQFSH